MKFDKFHKKSYYDNKTSVWDSIFQISFTVRITFIRRWDVKLNMENAKMEDKMTI